MIATVLFLRAIYHYQYELNSFYFCEYSRYLICFRGSFNWLWYPHYDTPQCFSLFDKSSFLLACKHGYWFFVTQSLVPFSYVCFYWLFRFYALSSIWLFIDLWCKFLVCWLISKYCYFHQLPIWSCCDPPLKCSDILYIP